jgi:hypothetical protein
LKHVFRLFILGVIELVSYIIFKPQDLETFFFAWTLIPFAFLILNIVNVELIDVGASIGTSQNNSSQIGYLGSKAAEILTNSSPRAKRIVGGILDPLNLAYIFSIIANIIGMMLVI